MDPLTIIAIATAAMNGLSQAIAIWPTVRAIVIEGRSPTGDEQLAIDAAADASHAMIQATG